MTTPPELPSITPHGYAEDMGPGYVFREDADTFIHDMQEASTLAELKAAWPGTVEFLESFHPDFRKALGAAYHRRFRQLNKPGRELDAPAKTHESKETKTMSRMTLASIERGKREKPFCVLVYGPEGVGKSTFAAGAPGAVFIGEAGGTDHLDVARFPSPQKWEDVADALTVLENESHDFKTVVIDTLDYLEPICWEGVCRLEGKKNIEAFGYGKGYLAAMEEFRIMLGRLEMLLEAKRMNVVLLAHAHVRTFHNPAGDDYDHYELRMHAKTAEILRAWPKAVLFANYRVYTNESKNDGRIRGVSDGSRILHCTPHPAWHAKNRYGLPDELPLSWDEFVSCATSEASATPVELTERIRAIVASGDEKLREAVEAAITKAGNDVKKLEQVKDRAIGKMKGQVAA
jgi:hypothetical protein